MGAFMSHRFSPRRGLSGVLLGLALLGSSAAHAAGAPELRAVALQKHDAGTFYVDGSLQGYGDLRMLVDTGSSYLVISQAILEELTKAGGAQYSRQLEGIMADGSSRVIPVYRLAGLRIGENCWINDVEAAILPGHTRPILGMNILARLAPFTFSADPPQLGVAQCQAQVTAPKAELTAVEAKAVTKGEAAGGVSQ
jgi:clan AA aspartic protease (TIGR02281 family)